ncbi:MAG: hydrogenase maturation protease [Acidimicrobiales bacterium]|jgi:hydrogenase maturation protease
MTGGGANPPSNHPAGPGLSRVVIASLGNEYRRDDGAGQIVAAAAADQLPGVRHVGPQVDPLELLGRWDGAELAVVIDATGAAGTPGAVRVVNLEERVESPGVTSTHGISLAGVLRLARAVGRAPDRVIVVGIEGEDFGKGPGLSPSVSASVPLAVRKVVELIEEARKCA